MVKGIEIFRAYFKEFADNYILIGGTACDEQMTKAGLTFRATKDLDIVLVVEALSSDFVKTFWEFIKTGKYSQQQKSEGERKYYRFLKPAVEKYPFQLELFARNPDLLDLSGDMHLTPIPVDDDLSSLSAILMNDDYYKFTIENSNVGNNLHLASVETLICLKAKAFLDLTARKEDGEDLVEKEIRKHKNDVIRLALLLTEDKPIKLPLPLANDMKKFMVYIESEPIDFKAIGKNAGIPNLDGERIVEQIKNKFSS